MRTERHAPEARTVHGEAGLLGGEADRHLPVLRRSCDLGRDLRLDEVAVAARLVKLVLAVLRAFLREPRQDAAVVSGIVRELDRRDKSAAREPTGSDLIATVNCHSRFSLS